MSPSTPILPECVALATLLRMSGLSKSVLADDLGISKSLISKQMTSEVPPLDRQDRILEKTGFERADYEELLSVLNRIAARRGRSLAPVTPVDPTPEEWSDIQARAIAVGREAERCSLEAQAEMARTRNAAAARAEAETLCALVENDPKPWFIVEKVREVQTWAVAEGLAHRSLELASDRADRAMDLAALAYRVAELAPCEGPFRESLLGKIMLYWGNATRAAGDIPAAAALGAEAKRHWAAGAAARGPLAEWRVLVLEGSLHRDQLRFADSLARLDEALAIAPERDKAGILIAKSCTLELIGDAEQAIAVLDEAKRSLDRQQPSWLSLCVRFNRATALCRLGQYGNAALALPEVKALANQLGRERLKIRVVWLEARVSAGLGDWSVAEAAFLTARRNFMRRNAAWDCAQVSLELAELLCRQKRSREALALFAEQEVGSEAMAALRLFCETAEGSAVPRELTERVLRLLQGSPGRPRPGGASVLPTFAAAGTAGIEPSAPLGGGGSDAAVATAVRVEDAAAVRGLGAGRGLQEIGGRAPDGGQPGDQTVHEAGGLQGGGPAGGQGG